MSKPYANILFVHVFFHDLALEKGLFFHQLLFKFYFKKH